MRPRILDPDLATPSGDSIDAGHATDEELVRRVGPRGGRAAAGDSGAADARACEAELCRRFAPRVRLYGLRHLRDEDRARDLVQAVSIVLLEAARDGRIEDPEHVDRFILGTCRNLVGRMRETDTRTAAGDPAEHDIAGPMPSFEHLDVAALFRCIAKLDGRSRVVLHMCFQDEASADEIGATLGTTAGNVRVLRHRAIAELRGCLDKGREDRP